MRTILSLLLTLCLCVAMMPLMAGAETAPASALTPAEAEAMPEGAVAPALSIRLAPASRTPDAAYPYLGLVLDTSEALRERIVSGEVFLYIDAIGDEEMVLREGWLDFRYVPEAARARLPFSDNEDAIFSYDAFSAWFDNDLEKLGRITSLAGEVDADSLPERTGYPVNEVIGTQDGYTLVYSEMDAVDLSQEAAAALADMATTKDSLEQTEVRPRDGGFIDFTRPPFEAGGDAQAFETTDIHGEPVTQSVFHGYRLSLVNVWATWCGPCIEEIPYLAEISAEMAADGVQVVGLLFDGVNELTLEPDEDAIETARLLATKLGAAYPMLLPEQTLMEGLLNGIQAFPTSFFVDEHGNVVGDPVIGSRDKAEWEALIGERLAMLGD